MSSYAAIEMACQPRTGARDESTQNYKWRDCQETHSACPVSIPGAFLQEEPCTGGVWSSDEAMEAFIRRELAEIHCAHPHEAITTDACLHKSSSGKACHHAHSPKSNGLKTGSDIDIDDENSSLRNESRSCDYKKTRFLRAIQRIKELLKDACCVCQNSSEKTNKWGLQNTKSKRIIGCTIAALFALLSVLIIALTTRNVEAGSSLLRPEESDFYPVKIDFQDNQRIARTTWINVKIINDTENEWYHNFEEAVEACQKLGAELWDVRNGEPEWNAVANHIREHHEDKLHYGIWLNGNVTSDCIGPDAECEQKASEGKGVPIVWPSRHLSNYSRLADKVSTNECIMFSSKDDLLWKSVDCSNSNFWALCVKRY